MDTKSKFIMLFIIAGLALLFSIQQSSSENAAAAAHSGEAKGEILCFLCHDAKQTAGFHYPDTIMKIEEKKEMRRRICVDCHGTKGNNADAQMSDPADIVWKENHYRLNPDIPHAIHQKKLNSGAMLCETCHMIKDNNPTQAGELPVIPTPKEGQILVCELCHLPDDGGNYVKIHVLSGSKQCETCHTGDLIGIHKRATAALGKIS